MRATRLRQEEEEEREEREKDRREIIDKLETSDKDATKLIAKSRANALRRTSARAASTTIIQSNAKLLRTRAAKDIPDIPHVPFNDNYYCYEDMYQLRPGGYNDFFSEAVRKDREGIMRAGGYKVEEAWDRALRYAVAGLDLAPLVGLNEPAEIPTATSEDIVMAVG